MSDDKREPGFYYSRERRIERASQEVKDIYRGDSRKGFMRLFGSKGNLMIFLCILMIIAMSALGRYIVRRGEGISLGGNTISASLLLDGDDLFLAILKTAQRSGEIYIGEVEIIITPASQGDSEPYTVRTLFSPIESESFLFLLPFDGNDFFIIMRTEFEQRAIRLQL